MTIPLATRHIRLLPLAIVILAIAASLSLSSRPAAADPSIDTQEQAFLDMINEYRVSKGKGELAIGTILTIASDWYASDMANKNYFGHEQYCGTNFGTFAAHCDSLGRWPGERLGDFAFPSGQSLGENTAAGYSTAQAVFTAWRNSSGHDNNMLGNWTYIGIGFACKSGSYYGCYWVTDFGRVNPAPPNPTPTPTQATASPTPVPTTTPAPSAPPSPTGTPTPAPTAVPLPGDLTWDDLNCDGGISTLDIAALLEGIGGLEPDDNPCPILGQMFNVDGEDHRWGDVDCSGDITPLDGVQLLGYLAGIPINSGNANCPDPRAS